METVTTPNAPLPAGHYAQAVKHSGLVYVSGQLPASPTDNRSVPGPIEAQAERALANLSAILEAAGSGLNQVLKVTIYISDISLWPAVNAIYSRVFAGNRPARSIVPVKPLHFGFDIEVEAIAAYEQDV